MRYHRRHPESRTVRCCRANAYDRRQIDGIITAKAIADVYYILHKSFHSDDKSRQEIFKLAAVFQIAYTTRTDCLNALFSQTRDFEDAIMAASAKRVNADYIVTRNLKDYAFSTPPAISPEEALNMIS